MLERTIPPDHYWNQPVDRLLADLHTASGGLSTPEAGQRVAQFGPNVLKAGSKTRPLSLFVNQFKSPIILILLLATGVSALLQDWVDAVIILAIVLGSALLSFGQEYSANTAAAKLRAELTVKTTVVRDDQPQPVAVDAVVPGDVVLLSAGSLVPADGVVLDARDFFVSQAVLTGETFPVEKRPGVVAAAASLTERDNCVFMGTSVRSGTARALMVQTGRATAFGQIAERLTLRPPAC